MFSFADPLIQSSTTSRPIQLAGQLPNDDLLTLNPALKDKVTALRVANDQAVFAFDAEDPWTLAAAASALLLALISPKI